VHSAFSQRATDRAVQQVLLGSSTVEKCAGRQERLTRSDLFWSGKVWCVVLMVCIYCGSETKVSNSRHQKRLNHVWRRRKCLVCKAIFSTTESADAITALRVRNKRSLEPFLRDNLLMSVYDSLRHRKSALTDATSLTATIVSNMYDLADNGVIEREAVVAVTGSVLERFDKIAAIHYKAFHPLEPHTS